jgi:hypothetical protein
MRAHGAGWKVAENEGAVEVMEIAGLALGDGIPKGFSSSSPGSVALATYPGLAPSSNDNPERVASRDASTDATLSGF